MAFFKFRKAADEPAKAPPPPQSIEAVRQRAKYRLVGATVLVVIGVIVLPLLFDKQPRPIAVDTPIDIPDRNKVPPLVLPAPASAPAAAVTPSAIVSLPVSGLTQTAAASTSASSSAGVLPAREASQAASVPAKAAAEAASAATKVIAEVDKKTPLAPVNKASDATKNAAKVVAAASSPVKVTPPATAKAAAPAKVTDAKPVVKPTDAAPVQAGRYILQVGAFADTTRAHEVRLKLEHAGLKTYTHVADTPEGKRIRVRVGPFAAKAEAEKIAVKSKKLNLPAALLTL